ncbi:ABC transporter ATP-binding protein [Tengunoibacter tsumagoiensis]|uniref:Daunorubicin resistance protein DrrA family ABC transporter ATP-binding protein n=1 Tax=Tengunoibacter tsumagoiensis TaxID=2014871 RepID=A0A402A980_9CHLR|nr:ABC transporter ATP-binding protein [Tengunoibacter tsumagoiensis]GCE15658.1 daunorubicin resistance protein DrrA family ABC transporter ATP-binding protein [Tengunoibacter tsumagoiensis]
MAVQTHPSAAIEITHLYKSYRIAKGQTVHAVQDLSLSVPAGQILGFLGANGAGKTTTIKMICGLITPSAGQVSVNGYNVTRQHPQAMRQIGAVLEGTRNVYWRLTPWQNLMYFGQIKQKWGQALRIRAEELLRDLELWDRRNDPIRLFSRGMQQKVAIACAVIADPPIILLDEPTLGLDTQASRTVKEWVLRLAREEGKTVILTTHQLDMAQDLCDRVAIMRKGLLLADQPLSELLYVFRQEYYQVRVRGALGAQDLGRFQTLELAVDADETLIKGAIANQEDVYELLALLQHAHVPLLTVEKIEPDLEEVFIQLVEERKTPLVQLQGASS